MLGMLAGELTALKNARGEWEEVGAHRVGR